MGRTICSSAHPGRTPEERRHNRASMQDVGRELEEVGKRRDNDTLSTFHRLSPSESSAIDSTRYIGNEYGRIGVSPPRIKRRITVRTNFN